MSREDKFAELAEPSFHKMLNKRQLWLNWIDEEKMKVWTSVILYKSDEGAERLRKLDVLARRIAGV